MKKLSITLFLIGIIIASFIVGGGFDKKDNSVKTEYLRIHIRANSNASSDQTVKYLIKDAVVDFLTPYLVNVNSKDEAIKVLNSLTDNIKQVTDNLLSKNGFKYTSKVSIDKEKFPTRWYQDYCLPEGIYDAVIIYLGEASGDNWWCVVYPPLCFTETEDITYKSIFAEVIRKFYKKEK